ncbi:hypothetical protein M2401_001105 [Pseudomonas sp. JUb42]|jgi:hypothetical protein|uniref:hypothetical protein n=1 Tax=Pseudomonas sp. JUb42 TaxID=2940611 RepID=UPI00216AAED0|nr:hypothetical protein [Pseudomonas sp. JUb42]MCS3467384.1 hypothetical protein [Pseudomonas sp. JUb42]
MTQQIIELGQLPDGAGGDTNRSANVKCNENFTELYETVAEKMAEKGANSDITSLLGLTTALSVAQGGTGAKDASEAREQLGAAHSGKNEDITELTGLTTALSVEQGGTGAKTGADACHNIGAMALAGVNLSVGTILRNGDMPHIAAIDADRSVMGPLMFSNAGNINASAVITFHRDGHFGCHFGIDTDNQLKVGGWSMGQVAHKIFHGGNSTRAADGTLKVV